MRTLMSVTAIPFTGTAGVGVVMQMNSSLVSFAYYKSEPEGDKKG
jgi:hypothetical protein